MGNNHEKNFSKKQRKILVLGVQKSGKTTFVQCVDGKDINIANYVETNDLDIIDVKKEKISLQFYVFSLTIILNQRIIYDFAGCERKRIFWRHHYIGAQGIIYVVDGSSMEKFQESLDALHQVLKERNLANVPICVFINKSDIKIEDEIISKIDQQLKEVSVQGQRLNFINKRIIQNCKLCQRQQQEQQLFTFKQLKELFNYQHKSISYTFNHLVIYIKNIQIINYQNFNFTTYVISVYQQKYQSLCEIYNILLFIEQGHQETIEWLAKTMVAI